MKRIFPFLLALILIPSSFGARAAHGLFEGAVEAGVVISLYAPSDGVIESVPVLPGQKIAKGEAIAVYRKTRVFAPFDGTVAGLSASEGDILSQNEPALLIEPREKFTLSASASYAYDREENRILHAGERLYLSCVTDGSHRGYGVVTEIEGENYTVLAVAGEFYPGEAVNVFRGNDAQAARKVGRATAYLTDAEPVTASGYVSRLFVKNGDRVEKGDALFDVVSGECESAFAVAGGIVTDVSVSPGQTVKAGDVLMKIAPEDGLVIACEIPESDLRGFEPGAEAVVVFVADPAETPVSAQIVTVYRAQTEKTFRVLLKPDSPPIELRLGMTAEVLLAE